MPGADGFEDAEASESGSIGVEVRLTIEVEPGEDRGEPARQIRAALVLTEVRRGGSGRQPRQQ